MLAKSSDGAGDLVRLCSTCEYFKILIERPHVLSMVNLHRLTSNFDYTKYHGRNDLILQCALAQNPIAELILGKALLNDQEWFSDMPGDTWVIGDYTSSSGLLYSHKLVRSFILYGSCEDIINMHYKLIGYVVCYVRFDKNLSVGIIEAIDNMCSDNVSDRDNVIVLFDQLPPKTLVFEFRDFN